MEIRNFNGTYLAHQRQPTYCIGMGKSFAEAVTDCIKDIRKETEALEQSKGRKLVAVYKPIQK